MILTPGGRDKNELPSGTDPAHWAEQQNLVSPLTRRSKTDAWTLSVRWALRTPVVEKDGPKKIASSGEGAVSMDRSTVEWLVPLLWRNQVRQS